MTRQLTLLIAVADGEHARFVRPDTNNTLHTVRSLDSTTAHLRSRDLGSDQPGRAVESGGSGARHAVEPRHDPHTLEKERFIRLVAAQLNEASAAGEFAELLLVAPARLLAELQETLDTTTKAKLVGTLEKDLVKTPDHELWPHLREWVHPVHRPAA
ncbi:MAG: host attachment protein [Acetobacteraceae bacterium]